MRLLHGKIPKAGVLKATHPYGTRAAGPTQRCLQEGWELYSHLLPCSQIFYLEPMRELALVDDPDHRGVLHGSGSRVTGEGATMQACVHLREDAFHGRTTRKSGERTCSWRKIVR